MKPQFVSSPHVLPPDVPTSARHVVRGMANADVARRADARAEPGDLP